MQSSNVPTTTWQTVNRRRQISRELSHVGPTSPATPRKSSGGIQQQVSRVESSSSKRRTSSSYGANSGQNIEKDIQQHLKPTQALLETVARDIPKNSWRWVFRELMSNSPRAENYIQNIENNYEKDLGEQKFQALKTWLDCSGDKATVVDFDRALRNHDCSSVADKHTGPVLARKTSQDYVDGASSHKDDGVPNFAVRHISVEESTIQISQDGNTVTFCMPKKILNGIPKQGDASSHEDKSKIAVALLANIINPEQSPHHQKIRFSTMADKFNEKYGSFLKFRHLGVGKLKSFIHKSVWFTVVDSDGELYVQQIPPSPKHSFSLDSGLSSNRVHKSVSSDEDSDSDIVYSTCLPSISETPHRTPPFARRFLDPLKLGSALGFEECLTADLLEKLLNKPKGKCLKFVLESDYLDKRKFTHDIVSLWNTADRENSYIVVGVAAKSSPPHDLVGVKEVKHDRYYQSLFLEESFSYKPPYKYSEILFEGNRYGVITIPSSKGFGNGDPCYAEKNDQEGLWHQENICYCSPQTLKNTIALRKATKKIIKWFGGSLTEDPRSPKENVSQEWEQDWGFIQTQLRKLSQNMSPSLVVSRCNPDTRYLGTVGKFPWIKVWDFDPQSQKSGVLNACYQEGMDKEVKVSTCKETAHNIESDRMDWVFVRGSEDVEDSVVDTKDPREWFASVKTSMNSHCHQLAQYCQRKRKPLLVVVLWYDNFQHIMHLARLLQKIDDETENTQFVLIMPHLPTDRAQSSSLENLRQQVGIEHVPLIPLTMLCQKLYHCPCPYQAETSVKYMLPICDGTYDANINDTDMQWYNEEIEILCTCEDGNTTCTDLVFGESFFGGGLLQWSDCELGMVDARRSLHKPLMQQLNGFLRKQSSALINLFHEPSSGGTTLGRRLLWDLHLMYPCVYISSNSFQPGHIYERLESLHQKTQLPLVVLIDGAEQRLVKELESDKRHHEVPTVILHIQQYSGDMDGRLYGGNQYWLTGKVDYLEAVSLAHVYSHNCSEEVSRKLKMLVGEVKEGKPHYMYEFRQVED